MMMRRIGSMIGRDLKASTREFLTVWVLVAPFVLALVIRGFVPAVGGAGINLVVTSDLGADLTAALRQYANVEVVPDRAALERRVLLVDDVAGVVRDTGAGGGGGSGALLVVLQGNEQEESRELPGLILATILGEEQVQITERSLGRQASPIRPYMAGMLALSAALFGGIIMGFAIIEDKTAGTMSALGVSPLSSTEYIAGRATLGMSLAVIMTFASLYIMGAAPFDPLQVLSLTVSGALLAVTLGFIIGSVANNPIEAIGTFKFGFMPFWIIPVLGLVVPQAYQFTLYWMPTYWIFFGYREIFLNQAGWGEVGPYAATAFGVSLLFFAVSWRLLRRRLTLRG
ncbi:MAG: ABC transporter permease [Bacillota bacterium]|nr:ABC transporter permease [Bacillota bacterium]